MSVAKSATILPFFVKVKILPDEIEVSFKSTSSHLLFFLFYIIADIYLLSLNFNFIDVSTSILDLILISPKDFLTMHLHVAKPKPVPSYSSLLCNLLNF